MIDINLLPKEYQKKKFRIELEKNTIYVIGTGLLVLALLSAYTVFFQFLPLKSLDKKIYEAKTEAQKYDSEIALVKELEEKKNLILTRMRTIEELDQNRDIWVKVVSDLGSRIPNYLWLTKFSKLAAGGTDQVDLRAGGVWKTEVEGMSFSLNSVATFLIRLKRSSYFKNVEIKKIEIDKSNQEINAYLFVINCDLVFGDIDNTDIAMAEEQSKMEARSF
jgi:type IV pilus assembly protein PilN